jgi:hypothetical protein
VGVPSHVHQFTVENVPCVARVRGIDERVLRAKDIVGIVPLDRLRQKGQADQEDDPQQEDES